MINDSSVVRTWTMKAGSMKEDQLHSTETLFHRKAPHSTTPLATTIAMITTLHLLLAITVFIRALGMVLHLLPLEIGREVHLGQAHLQLQVPG
jgi:hypothetical protein